MRDIDLAFLRHVRSSSFLYPPLSPRGKDWVCTRTLSPRRRSFSSSQRSLRCPDIRPCLSTFPFRPSNLHRPTIDLEAAAISTARRAYLSRSPTNRIAISFQDSTIHIYIYIYTHRSQQWNRIIAIQIQHVQISMLPNIVHPCRESIEFPMNLVNETLARHLFG